RAGGREPIRRGDAAAGRVRPARRAARRDRTAAVRLPDATTTAGGTRGLRRAAVESDDCARACPRTPACTPACTDPHARTPPPAERCRPGKWVGDRIDAPDRAAGATDGSREQRGAATRHAVLELRRATRRGNAVLPPVRNPPLTVRVTLP